LLFLVHGPPDPSHPIAICHPEQSGPTFSFAPNCGASGRAVEGSLLRLFWCRARLFTLSLAKGRGALFAPRMLLRGGPPTQLFPSPIFRHPTKRRRCGTNSRSGGSVPGAPGSVFYLGLGVLFSSNSALSASSVVNTLRFLPRHLRSLCGPSVTSAVGFSLSSWLFSVPSVFLSL
jgi:hypothetical protein